MNSIHKFQDYIKKIIRVKAVVFTFEKVNKCYYYWSSNNKRFETILCLSFIEKL